MKNACLPILFLFCATIYFAGGGESGRDGADRSNRILQAGMPRPWNQVALSGETVQVSSHVRTINGVAVPSDFPEFDIRQYGETAPGRIFFGSTFTNVGNYLVILENDGTPYFYRRYTGGSKGSGEFKVQYNGILSAYLFGPQYYILMDYHFNQVDTMKCQRGYTTDAHEMLLLPDGHALFICDDEQRIDMSQVVIGGNKNAVVLGNHVQETDEQDSVVFEWRCWDHFDIDDAVHEDLRSSYIDYVHMNSIAMDYDGHLVISSRHLSEVTKIDHNTGDIIWRFGGEHNQFTLINDLDGISYQHYVKPVPDKPDHYTIFDNGNFGHPQYSRAVEFKLDTATMTAEKVWEFRCTPDRYSFMMGSVQRLGNGNTFINWSTWPPGFACEVAPDGRILYELTINGTAANRIRRFEWDGMLRAPYLIAESFPDGVVLIFNKFGDRSVMNYIIYAGKSQQDMSPVDTTTNTYTILTELDNLSDYYFKVCAVDGDGVQSEFSDIASVFVKFDRSGENLVLNGDFESDMNHWSFILAGQAAGDALVQDGELNIRLTDGGGELEDAQVYQERVALTQGKTYKFGFDAYAGATRTITPMVGRRGSEPLNYSQTSVIVIRPRKRRYEYQFTMINPSDDDANVIFNCGGSTVSCNFDNIFIQEALQSQVAEPAAARPQPELLQNYPNPFNPVTFIRFSVPEQGLVILRVFNLSGQCVNELANRKFQEGTYQVEFDASSAASGIYFYEMKMIPDTKKEPFRIVKKMTVVR